MRTAAKVCMVLPFVLTALFAQDAATPPVKTIPGMEDLATVKTILNLCKRDMVRVEDITASENGRVISLDLSNKDFSSDGIAALPGVIGDLTELRTLVARDNSIKEIPFELYKCKKLRKLDLGSNKISFIPTALSEFDSLEYLDLRYNNISSIPPEIAKVQTLQVLQLWGNKLVEIEPSVTILPKLKEIYLKDNRLTSLPDGITKMKSLTYIDLAGNFLCAASPAVDKWLKAQDKRYRQTQKCR